MCGIAGVIKRDLSADDVKRFSNKFSDSLQHRGPDDSGSWHAQSSGVLLTHRRLSIHDLSPLGAQPMHSASNRYCIVFNGEIYNYQELKAELSQLGHVFRGGSDTEVLLAAIEQWGMKSSVRRFTGMFAFALWDKQDKTLQLCRDRLGEKPLYYGVHAGTFYFASELHAIESIIRAEDLDINIPGLQQYLQYGYIPSPYTIYNGFHKLQPGSLLTISIETQLNDATELHPEVFWSLREIAESGISQQLDSFEDTVEILDNKLQEVIKRQLLADVNVGLFLSGGIDSTTVTAIAQSVSAQPVKTFTIGYHEKEYDESRYAAAIAKHLNTEHTTLHLSPDDAKSVIPELPKIYDEPFADSSQIPAYLVSKLAREHVTVCLSGDGGDELFAGYNRYLMTNRIWSKIDRMPMFLRKVLGKTMTAIPSNIRDALIALLYKNKQGSLQSKIQKLAGVLQSPDVMAAYDLLSSYWANPQLLIKQNGIQDLKFPVLSKEYDFLEQAMYIDQIRYLEGDNLAKTDRASMAVSLETRLPLLSHDIVELSWKIPIHMKIHHNTSKWVLRNVLYKYVPENLIDRPKMGFSVPIAQWLRGSLKEWADDHFSLLHRSDLLNSKLILRAWDEHKNNKADHASRLWTVLMFLAWQADRYKSI